MTRKARHPENIKHILDKVIGKIEKESPRKKEEIQNAWHKAAGEKTSTHSRPAGVKRKTLTIEVDSSTWLYSLSLRKNELLGVIKKELGEERVKDIRFRMGDFV